MIDQEKIQKISQKKTISYKSDEFKRDMGQICI